MAEITDRATQIAEEQIAEEQQAVDTMYTRLDTETMTGLRAREEALSSPIDGPEDRVARDADLSRLDKAIRRLRKAEHALCFGRIDGTTGGAPLYIGRIGLLSDSHRTLLVDWRADAARPFYAATAASPLGVRRRRHLRLRDREVVELTDEILDGTAPIDTDVVGDSPLVSALSGARTGRMREAMATLQAEQDEIVRSEHRGIMVVDGGPGTGKTIVALHRAAYVLYAFPAIADRGVLVFGPNRRFLTYISDVLPSLGENDVALRTTTDLVDFTVTRTETDPIALAKGCKHFAELLAGRVETSQPRGIPLRLRTGYGAVVLDPARVDAARRSALQGGVGHNRARQAFLEQIVDEAVTELEAQTAQEISDFEDEIRNVLGIDLDRMFAGEARPSAYDDDGSGELEIDWDRIHDDLLDDAEITRAIDEVWPFLTAEGVVRDVLTDAVSLTRHFPRYTDKDVASIVDCARQGWSMADLALLDEARTLVDGPPESVYGHIVVDEAQQLSQMQWRMLMRRCPNHSMTIVGDLAQSGPTTTISSWGEALHPFVDDRFVHHTLTINYRTTAEILETTAPVLARIAPTQRLSRSIRHGEHPTTGIVANDAVDSEVDELLAAIRAAHPGELIGIITTARRASCFDAGALGDDVMVVPAADARGLEFDTVIVLGANEIRGADHSGLRDLYVAQTRATKRLVMLDIGGPVPDDGAA